MHNAIGNNDEDFGTDGVRGRVGEPPITPELVLQARLRRRTRASPPSRRRKPGETPGGADRQGHAHLRLSARSRARGRALGRRRRRVSLRAAAHARGRLSHARAAPLGRHRHQRLAQPVRGQRHQVLLRRRARSFPTRSSRRSSAARRADRVRRVRGAGQGVSRQRCRRAATSSSARARFRTSSTCKGLEDRRRLRARRGVPRRAAGVPRAGRRGDRDRQRARRAQHQRRRRRDASAPSAGRGGASTAPTSVSRSTATAIAC